MIRDRMRGRLSAEIFHDLDSVSALWRGLEASPGAVATPYQRFDWVAAFVADEGGPEAGGRGSSLRIMVLRDEGGRAQLLIPLRISRDGGFAVARVIGAKHANYHMPLYASPQGAAIPAEEIEAALARAGREAGIDVYALDHQPRFWDGTANPLSARGAPCASDAYGLLLGPDAESTLRRAFSGDARKKLRAKERKLVEALGPVEHRIGTSPEAVAAILEAFYAQKAARFAAMGVPNPYAGSAVRRFIARGTARGGAPNEAGDAARDATQANRTPAIEVHALVATNTDRILATFGAAVDQHRFSGMWTSFDTDPDLGRFSSGDLLLHRLIGQQTEAGRRVFDLGVGEARYKASICDETIELAQVLIPVSPRGHLYAAAARAAARAKHRMKRSPRLWEAVRRLRRLRYA